MKATEIAKLRESNLSQSRKDLQESIGRDILIVQAVGTIDSIDKVMNEMVVRLKEWYAWNDPELVHAASTDEIIEAILSKKQPAKDSMGAKISANDQQALSALASSIKSLIDVRANIEEYIEVSMKETCPNIAAVAGALLGARMLAIAGSLKKLSLFPASTVQLLGAEKALFSHLVKGTKSPKYGLLFGHPIVKHAKAKDKGRIARALADKISICARIDYFKGKFLGDKLYTEILAKFKIEAKSL